MLLTLVLPLPVFFSLGFLTHLAEKRWPLRAYEAPSPWMLDALFWGASITATVACRIAFPHLFGRLANVPGIAGLLVVSHAAATALPWPVTFLISVILLDFLLYWSHRLLHTSLFWHTHAAHHSVEHLYWFAGNRASPVHIIVQLTCGALLGLIWPVSGGANAIVASTVLYNCIQHFNHANISWRLGKLEWLIVVPRYHFVHHGEERRLNDSNFGFLFTVWDRMFGTYTNPDSAEDNFRLGLNYEVGLGRLFIGLGPKAEQKAPALSSASSVEGAQ
ncbi:MAG TPA: sterol desaturase family protein [Gemmatimonadaceae bacterium]|jgi:sterol desaturase/sphingolipid hydroxylase (fatty acid hydroxylase superfamily)